MIRNLRGTDDTTNTQTFLSHGCARVEVPGFVYTHMECKTRTSKPFLIVLNELDLENPKKTVFSATVSSSLVWQKQVTARLEQVLAKASCHAGQHHFISIGGTSLGYYALLAASHGFNSLSIIFTPRGRQEGSARMQESMQRASIAQNAGFSKLMSVHRVGRSKTVPRMLCMDPPLAASNDDTVENDIGGEGIRPQAPCPHDAVPVVSLSSLVHTHEPQLR